MRLKAKEATEMVLSMGEIRDQIKDNFKKGDELHVLKGKRVINKRTITFVQGFDSFFVAESVVNAYYSETVSIAYADLLIGNVIIQEIYTKKPIVK